MNLKSKSTLFAIFVQEYNDEDEDDDGGGYFTWLLRKHKCFLVSNQTADGFRSSLSDLVMRIIMLYHLAQFW